MLLYLLRRLVFAVFLVFAVSSASLVLTRLAPGDFAVDQLGVRHTPVRPSDTIDANGFPLGGNAELLFNVELRVPVWRVVQAHGFVDTGNVFKRAVDLDFREFRTAAGFGLLVNSPVGPLRFDLGFKVNRLTDESLTAFFITFGRAF